MPTNTDHEHVRRPTAGGERDIWACSDANRHRRAGTIIASVFAAVDPDDVVTARPTDDETINEYGRRVAMIADEFSDPRWTDGLGLDF